MFELLPKCLPAKTHFSHRSQRGKMFGGLQARIQKNGLHESRAWDYLGVSCRNLPQLNELAKHANPLASLVFGVRFKACFISFRKTITILSLILQPISLQYTISK